jgi:enamine deaminase RidA (YjgF/YER057c/UK114 family)
MATPEQRLKELGITLPTPAKPVANYVGWVKTGNLAFVAGQLPMVDGKVTFTGRLGAGVDKDAAKAAARQSAINVLAQLREACDGDLSKVRRIVKLTAFVSCTGEFTEHPFIVNGASDLMVEVFGDAGRHARTSIGVPSLPLNACVEVDAVVEIA